MIQWIRVTHVACDCLRICGGKFKLNRLHSWLYFELCIEESYLLFCALCSRDSLKQWHFQGLSSRLVPSMWVSILY